MINKMNNFYVYIYLDPRKQGSFTYGDLKFDYEPFYVGKGSLNRIDAHIIEAKYYNKKNAVKEGSVHRYNKILKILKEGLEPIRFKVFDNLLESEAFEKERYLIQLIGRHDQGKGTLTNNSDGGEGNSNPSIEARNKISEKMTGCVPWNKGLKNPYSEEDINKKKATIKKNRELGLIPEPWNKGLKNPYTEESNKSRSEKMSGSNNPHYKVPRTEKQKQISSETFKKYRAEHDQTGSNNPNFENHWSQEQKDHLGKVRREKGILPSNLIKVEVLDLIDNTSTVFQSKTKAFKSLKMGVETFERFLLSGEICRGRYIFKRL